MSIITVAEAKTHLRLESSYPDDQLQGKIGAAEAFAAQFLNRAIYADETARSAGISTVSTALTAAGTAFKAASDAARLLTDATAAATMLEHACAEHQRAVTRAQESLAGIVITPDIRAAVLLIVGHLFANLADSEERAVTSIPTGAERMLLPHRIGWGG